MLYICAYIDTHIYWYVCMYMCLCVSVLADLLNYQNNKKSSNILFIQIVKNVFKNTKAKQNKQKT